MFNRMSPVKVFPTLSFPDPRLEPIFQNSEIKARPLKWSEARRMALQRDRVCRICNSDMQLTVHHMWPRGLGGGHEIENLVTLCEPCHQHLCSACSRAESDRVPGWVKPDLIRQQGKQPDNSSGLPETDKNPGGLSGIFSEEPISLALPFPQEITFFLGTG